MPGASTTARGLPVVDLGTGLKGDPIPVPGDSPPSRDDTLASISSMLDNAFGTTRGGILYRGASSWALRAPGTSGFFLKSFGAGADPDYAAVAAGDVTGPGVAVDGDFAQFNGTTGKIIKDGGLSLDTDGTLAANSDTRIPSQKAVKTYAVTKTGAPASGNLAKFSGASSVTNGDLSGDVSTTGTLATTLANSGVAAGSYGDSTHIPSVTVDAKGRVTAASQSAITVPAGANPTAVASDVAVNGAAATFMRSDGAPAVQLGSNTQFGLAKGDGTTVSIAAGIVSVIGSGISGTGSDADFDLMFFGTGIDGDLAIAAGTTNLTRDMFYHNLTISGTGKLNLNGWRVYVSGTLDLTNAPAGAVVSINNLGVSLNGTNGTNLGNSGAGGSSLSVSNTVGKGQGGGAGGVGATGAGAQAVAVANGGNALPNTAGTGGKGGNTGSAGGAARAGGTGAQPLDIRKLTDQLFTWQNGTINYIIGGIGAPGGGGGAGDGVGAGGGGGGGGATPGVVWIAARTIARSSSTTAAAAINADAGNGGNGGSPTGGTNAGGGGGAGGAPGGWVMVIYRFLTGTAKTGLVSAAGGNGGNGGTGRGTGIGGDGGASGSRGRLDLYNLAAGTWTHAETDTTTVAGTAGSGSTGGPGGTANSQSLSL